MANESFLLHSVSDRIGTMTLNRPDRGNALTPELLLELHKTLDQWATADEVRAVVITGQGDKAFCSGYDIRELANAADTEAPGDNPLALAFDSIRTFPYPVIAMVNGHMFGAGLNLALCCDLRIGSDRIEAGMPPAKLGLVYPLQGLKQFIDTIGIVRTREAFFTGRTYAGEEVKTMGFVDRQIMHGALAETTYSLAAEIAGNAPVALKGIKKLLGMLTETGGLKPEDVAAAQALVDASMVSEDAREGQLAFFEKRKPKFTGR